MGTLPGMTNSDVTLPAIRGPEHLLAAVPYLLGFHPTDSVVAVGLRGTAVTFAARVAVPRPGGADAKSGFKAILYGEDGRVVGVDAVGPEGRQAIWRHGGQPHPARGAEEELGLQVGLQPLDPRGERGLREEEPVGGAAHAPRPRHLDEGLDLVQQHKQSL